jgi:archaellum component FlaC
MGFFGFGKKEKVLDLTNYRGREKTESVKNSSEQNQINFPDDQLSEISENFQNTEEKKKKLAKRIADMTAQLENISNQIYHLQQRVEVLERKSGL